MSIRTALASHAQIGGNAPLLVASAVLGLIFHGNCVGAAYPGNSQGCYGSVDLQRPAASMPIREIVLAVDQTTRLPERTLEVLLKTIDASVIPGDRISVVTFSAYSARHHLHRVLTVEMERRPTARDARRIPVTKMRSLEQCLEFQTVKHRKILRSSVRRAVADASQAIQRSEIINALQVLGPPLVAFQGPRILLIVSDGLEHAPGATTTFYESKDLRHIDPEKELAAVKSKKHLAQLTGVRVFFFGGAMTEDESAYRNTDAVAALREFWTLYIGASGGVLAEFGTPELQSPLLR